MDHAARNIQTIQGIYKSFGEKNIPAILERLSDDVEWEMGVSSGYGVPWLSPGRGREHALKFFQSLGGLEFRAFEVVGVVGGGDLVVGIVNVELFNPKTGKGVREQYETHVWRFDERGQITGMRHGADTHAHWLACQS